MKVPTKAFEILLVEDNEGDIGLITELFSDAKVIPNLHIAEDGEEAIRFLCGKDQVFRFSTPRYNYFGFEFTKKRWT